MLDIDNKISPLPWLHMALHTAVAQAELTFDDAIKITQTITKWCFL